MRVYNLLFFYKNYFRISIVGKIRINRTKHYKPRERQYLQHYLLDTGFEGTIVHRALSTLHGGSVEVTLYSPCRDKAVQSL